MAKHKFLVAKRDAKGNLISARCVTCGKIALYKDTPEGRKLEDLSTEECKREDASQAAARIVRQATEEK